MRLNFFHKLHMYCNMTYANVGTNLQGLALYIQLSLTVYGSGLTVKSGWVGSVKVTQWHVGLHALFTMYNVERIVQQQPVRAQRHVGARTGNQTSALRSCPNHQETWRMGGLLLLPSCIRHKKSNVIHCIVRCISQAFYLYIYSYLLFSLFIVVSDS